jgi:hypothetical protein
VTAPSRSRLGKLNVNTEAREAAARASKRFREFFNKLLQAVTRLRERPTGYEEKNRDQNIEEIKHQVLHCQRTDSLASARSRSFHWASLSLDQLFVRPIPYWFLRFHAIKLVAVIVQFLGHARFPHLLSLTARAHRHRCLPVDRAGQSALSDPLALSPSDREFRFNSRVFPFSNSSKRDRIAQLTRRWNRMLPL